MKQGLYEDCHNGPRHVECCCLQRWYDRQDLQSRVSGNMREEYKLSGGHKWYMTVVSDTWFHAKRLLSVAHSCTFHAQWESPYTFLMMALLVDVNLLSNLFSDERLHAIWSHGLAGPCHCQVSKWLTDWLTDDSSVPCATMAGIHMWHLEVLVCNSICGGSAVNRKEKTTRRRRTEEEEENKDDL